MLDTDVLNAIMDSPIVPGTRIDAVLCPSGRDETIRITLRCRNTSKALTFGLKPSEPLADIRKAVVRMSNQLSDNVRNPKQVAVKQKSFLKS
jgi:hypothetical protein